MLTTLDANNSSHSKTTKYSHDATTIYTISSYNDSVSNSFSIRLATPGRITMLISPPSSCRV
jgi:hypothetical protein